MIRYNLDNLGWYQFEWLCQTLLKTSLGIGVECWGGHSDLGRDAYFAGDLQFPLKTNAGKGPFIFQMKFVEEANAVGSNPSKHLLKAVQKERNAIRKRIEDGDFEEPGTYVIFTNASLNPVIRADIKRIIQEVLPKTEVFSQGADDICSMLDENPKIRGSFPQLLGLGDLSRLLNDIVSKPILERSKYGIERAKGLSGVFVPTEAYSKTLMILAEHSFVVLTGPPEMGKTAIARMVGLAKLSDNWQYLEIKKPDEFSRLYEEAEKQVFLVDDAFGSTEFYAHLAREWEGDLDLVINKLNQNHWLIWTSRSEPLKKAILKMHLQGRAEKFPEPAKIIVDAKELTQRERALILYRHAKNAGLSNDEKAFIRLVAKTVVVNAHFTPERIRAFVNDHFRKILVNSENKKDLLDKTLQTVRSVIATPTAGMEKSFEALEVGEQVLLISMLDSGYHGVERLELENAFNKFLKVTGGLSFAHVSDVLTTHFLRKSIEQDAGKNIVSEAYDWMHPSWRDLVIDCLVKNDGYRNMFLESCGTIGMELAFSEVGGADGKRTWPFIVNQGDFDIASKTIERLLAECEVSEMGGVLEMLSTVHENYFGGLISKPFLKDSMVIDLVKKALTVCCARWNVCKVALDINDLGTFYELSEKIDPLPCGPDLSTTWTTFCERALSDLEYYESTAVLDSENSIAFSKLVKLIEDNEPRFLRQAKRNSDIFVRFESLFEMIKRNYEGVTFSVSNRDDYNFQLSKFGEVSNLISATTNMFPEQLPLLKEISQCVINAKHEFLEEYSDLYEENEDLDEDNGEVGADNLDLDELFLDL